jgi:hypothetical protein
MKLSIKNDWHLSHSAGENHWLSLNKRISHDCIKVIINEVLPVVRVCTCLVPSSTALNIRCLSSPTSAIRTALTRRDISSAQTSADNTWHSVDTVRNVSTLCAGPSTRKSITKSRQWPDKWYDVRSSGNVCPCSPPPHPPTFLPQKVRRRHSKVIVLRSGRRLVTWCDDSAHLYSQPG